MKVIRSIGNTTARVIERTGVVLNYIGVTTVLIMMVFTTADVILRYTIHTPILGVTKLSEFLMVAVVFLGLAYTQAQRGHVKIDILVNRLRGKVSYGYQIFPLLVGLSIFALITWKSGEQALYALSIREYAHGIPYWPIYPSRFLVPLGSFVLCLQLLLDIVRSALQFRSKTKTARTSPAPAEESGL